MRTAKRLLLSSLEEILRHMGVLVLLRKHIACVTIWSNVERSGVDQSRILVEDRAIHTFHNALYTKTLLRQGEMLTKPLNLVIITTDWHAKRALLCFKAVFCDAPNVVLKTQLVPSESNDVQVKDRIVKEERLIARWIPLCVEEERDHPDMPALALVEQARLSSSLRALSEELKRR